MGGEEGGWLEEKGGVSGRFVENRDPFEYGRGERGMPQNKQDMLPWYARAWTRGRGGMRVHGQVAGAACTCMDTWQGWQVSAWTRGRDGRSARSVWKATDLTFVFFCHYHIIA